MSKGKRQNLSTTVAERLGSAIVRGEQKMDHPLPTEHELGDKFRVSRTVVREALKILSSKGLIATSPKRGASVRSSLHWNTLDADILKWREKDPSFYAELAELRRIVEPAAAGLAAERATKKQIRALEACLAEMISAEAASCGDMFDQADVRLHRVMFQATGNSLLIQLFELINPLIDRSRLATKHLLNRVPATAQHGALVAAIRDHRPLQARRAVDKIINAALSNARAASV